MAAIAGGDVVVVALGGIACVEGTIRRASLAIFHTDPDFLLTTSILSSSHMLGLRVSSEI